MSARSPRLSRFALAPAHLAFAVALGFGLPLAATWGVDRAPAHPAPGSLLWLYEQHGLQAILALVAIALLRTRLTADFGLHWPKGRSYVGLGVAGGLAFGLLSCLVLFALTGKPPPFGVPATGANIAGWLSFEGLYVGPTEEVLFRALLVTYLAAAAPGRVKLGRLELSIGGIVAALIFGLSHWGYGAAPPALALAQQVYAFALGLLYAYCFEKSGSLLAPAVAHNVSDGIVTLAAIAGTLAR